eukprot:scaffold400_cov185-Amphora_coffeaeformis.AAC.2
MTEKESVLRPPLGVEEKETNRQGGREELPRKKHRHHHHHHHHDHHIKKDDVSTTAAAATTIKDNSPRKHPHHLEKKDNDDDDNNSQTTASVVDDDSVGILFERRGGGIGGSHHHSTAEIVTVASPLPSSTNIEPGAFAVLGPSAHLAGESFSESEDTDDVEFSSDARREEESTRDGVPEASPEQHDASLVEAYRVSDDEDIEAQVNEKLDRALKSAPIASVLKISRTKRSVLALVLVVVMVSAITFPTVFIANSAKEYGSNTTQPCALCYNGREPEANASQLFDMTNCTTCGEMKDFLWNTYTEEEPECRLYQTLAYTQCGCPDLPPRNEKAHHCSLCPDGSPPERLQELASSDYILQGKNDMVPSYNSSQSYRERMSCMALDTYLSYASQDNITAQVPLGECYEYQVRDQIHCGCPLHCVDSLQSYTWAEAAVSNELEPRTYNLCPNTSFDVSPYHILVFRPNVRVVCGSDGNSTNNCVLRGEGNHFTATPDVRDYLGIVQELGDDGLTNVRVEGVTFTGGYWNRIVKIVATGDFLFRDCVFEDNAIGRGGILSATSPDSFDLFLDSSDLMVTVDDCVFRNNVAGISSENTNETSTWSSAMIEILDATLTVRNSLFQNNRKAHVHHGQTRNVAMILNSVGPLKLVGNCFVGNDVSVASVVNGQGGIVQVAHANFVSKNFNNTDYCGFIATTTSYIHGDTVAFEHLSFTCESHDAVECMDSELSRAWSRVVSMVQEHFGSTNELDDPLSPQYLAARWVANTDTALDLDGDLSEEVKTRLVQRYSLAALYFSTGGADSWRSKYNFLSRSHECEWNEAVAPVAGTEDFHFDGNFVGVSECAWSPEKGRVVVKLQFVDANLTGSLPSEIAGLVYLKSLNIDKNRALKGAIPETLFDLSNLEFLWLVKNDLSGTVQSNVGQMGRLTYLNVNGNSLSGSIPTEVGQLSLLVGLDLSSNALNGTIPQEVTDLTNLRLLSLSNNELSGSLPQEWSTMPILLYVFLQNNGLSKMIPESMLALNSLSMLRLDSNSLSGGIPDIFSKNHALFHLQLGSNLLNGTIPDSIGDLTDLGKSSITCHMTKCESGQRA